MDVKKTKDTILKSAAALKIRDFAMKYAPVVLCGIGGFVLAPCELAAGIRPFGIALAASVTGFAGAAAASVASMFSIALTARTNKLALYYIAMYAVLFGLRVLFGRLGETYGKTVRDVNGAERSKSRTVLKKMWQAVLASMPDVPFRETVMLRCIVAAASSFAGYSLMMFISYSQKYLFSAVFVALITPALTYAYAGVTEHKLRYTEAYGIGRAIFLFSIVTATREVSIFGISPAAVLAYSAALAVSHYYGPAKGSVTGLICGIAMSPMYSPAYAIGPLAAGLLWRLSPVSAVCVGGITSLSWVVYSGGVAAVTSLFPDIFTACAVSSLIAHYSLFAPKAELKSVDPSDSSVEADAAIGRKQTENTYARIREMVDSMSSVASIFTSMSEKLRRPSVAEIRGICESATDKKCRACENSAVCRGGEFSPMSTMLDKMTVSLHQSGRAGADCVPESIAARCPNICGILEEANTRCSKATRALTLEDRSGILGENYGAMSEMLRDVFERQAEDFAPDPELASRISRAISASGIYGESVAVYGSVRKKIFVGGLDMARTHLGNDDIRDIMSGIVGCPLLSPEYTVNGDRVSMFIVSAPTVCASHGRCSIAGNAKEANGDAAMCFSNRDGKFYSLISDGMGSGREAALTSRVSATFLARMLGSGSSMKDALGMLNGLIRAGTLECSATVDLMELDTYTGQAKFVKSGAAPSFILRDGKIFRLQSKTVPIGILRALDAEMIKLTLKPGDTVVMFSDGVASGFDDSPWLLDLLSENGARYSDPTRFAQFIAKQAKTKGSRTDDVTVTVLKISDGAPER